MSAGECSEAHDRLYLPVFTGRFQERAIASDAPRPYQLRHTIITVIKAVLPLGHLTEMTTTSLTGRSRYGV